MPEKSLSVHLIVGGLIIFINTVFGHLYIYWRHIHSGIYSQEDKIGLESYRYSPDIDTVGGWTTTGIGIVGGG